MVIESMRKTMFHRIGAFALAGMLAMSLMATPTFAADGADGNTTLTIIGTTDKAVYRVYKVLGLEAPAGGASTIATYKYALTTDEKMPGFMNDLLDAGFKFGGQYGKATAEKDGKTYNIDAGFELASNGSNINFKVEATSTDETAPKLVGQEAYALWQTTEVGKDRVGTFMVRFADELKKKVEDKTAGARPVKEVTATTDTVTIDGLDSGYYMVISGLGQRSMVFTAPGTDGGNLSITEKNDKPTVKKYVYEDATGAYSDDADKGSKNDKAIGDTVKFLAVLDVGTGVNHLKFVDTLSKGLTFDAIGRIAFAPRSSDGKDLLDKEGMTKQDLLSQVFDANAGYTREIYLDGNPHEGTNDTNKKTGTPWGKLWGEGVTKSMATVTEPGQGSNDANTLTVDFDSEWLMSKRQLNGAGDYDQDPIYPNDSKLEDAEKANHAMYNPYLGDMSTPQDDGGLIVIEYYATVNEKADIGGAGNTNTAKLEYGNDPDEVIGTAEDTTRTYVYELDILKHAAGSTKEGLADAKFTMKRAGNAFDYAPDGTDSTLKLLSSHVKTNDKKQVTIDLSALYPNFDDPLNDAADLKFVKGGDVKGRYRLAKKDEDGNYEAGADATLVSGGDGKLIIKGLDSDLYRLYETEAPNGYIKAEDPIYVVLGSVSSGSADMDGDNVGMHVYTQDTGATFVRAADIEGFDAIEPVAVKNAAGIVMPSTGGIGTTIFYIVGAALAFCAGALLFVKKRLGHDED